mmetsp:Transcript_19844/g.45904  ORF Transcript_19844/g.45904 Transcript_19844/m.45904 type:complete len:141 (+) Transcript_19844:37-459(+)|eukprot:1839409-Amphidinium_carterae.1
MAVPKKRVSRFVTRRRHLIWYLDHYRFTFKGRRHYFETRRFKEPMWTNSLNSRVSSHTGAWGPASHNGAGGTNFGMKPESTALGQCPSAAASGFRFPGFWPAAFGFPRVGGLEPAPALAPAETSTALQPASDGALKGRGE